MACKEGDKNGWKFGGSGKCYTYEKDDEASSGQAKRRAYLQGVAIGGGKLAKEDLDEIPDDLLKEAAETTQEYADALQTAIDLKKANGCHSPAGTFCANDSEHNFKLKPAEIGDIQIIKSDDEQQKIWGQVLRPNFVDLQGDVIDEREIEKAAHTFLEKARKVGLRHKGDAPATVIESYTAPIDFNLNGQTITKGTWIIGCHIKDPVIWKEIKEGRLNSFSIGGRGKRVDI